MSTNFAPLIMVFGISGVGKTTACEAFVKSNPIYFYDRASAIMQRAHRTVTEALRTTDSESIRSNQGVLPSAVMALREAFPYKIMLLDCHAIIDNDKGLVEVPPETIKDLKPDGFILLEADAAVVKQRRENAERVRPNRTVDQIEAEQIAERRTVRSYVNNLHIPLIIDNASINYDLSSAICRLDEKRFIG